MVGLLIGHIPSSNIILLKGAMCCLQAKPYNYRCYSCQAAVTSVLANRLFHVLGKDYFMYTKYCVAL